MREYEGSGLTQAAFARRAGVNYSTFGNWIQARRARTVGKKRAVRFVQMQLPAAKVSTSELSVTLPDGVVVRGANAQVLAELVRALRR